MSTTPQTEGSDVPVPVASGPIISVGGLSGGYGQLRVLHDIEFELPQASVVALLGRNGVGKTTLMKTLSGLLKPFEGTVTYSGTDVTNMSPQGRAELGLCFIPEGRAIFRDLTVEENIRLLAPPTMTDAHERVYSFFPRLGERRKYVASQMSGGEQQMLALSRAFLVNPTAVLVDEPSFGLAPRAIDLVFEALGKLAEAGTAILLVEQYIERALEFAHDVYIMDKGEMSYVGESKNLTAEDITSRYFGVDAPAG